jgi:hypothetical protein
MLFAILGAGLFLGFMIPTLLISAMPKVVIKLLEIFRFYKPGTLVNTETTYIAGNGYYRQGKVYTFNDETHTSRFDNGRVFGYLLLIFIPSVVFVSFIVYLFI